MAIARRLLNVDTQSLLPIGIGYLGWLLDQVDAPNSAQDLLAVALDNNVQAVWFSFGVDLTRWIRFIRDNEHSPGTIKVFVQVTSLEEAIIAVKEWKLDVVVAQGSGCCVNVNFPSYV